MADLPDTTSSKQQKSKPGLNEDLAACLHRLRSEADNLQRADASCQGQPAVIGVCIDFGQFSKDSLRLQSASYDRDVITEDHR